MIVECIGKDKTYLPQCIVKEGLGSFEEDNSITVGKKYVVYAVYTMKFNLQYLICDDYYENKTRYWPMFRPAVFFKIIDSTISKYWVTREEIDEYDILKRTVRNKGFIALFDIPYFYGDLVEGDKECIKIWGYYKDLIDKENQ